MKNIPEQLKLDKKVKLNFKKYLIIVAIFIFGLISGMVFFIISNNICASQFSFVNKSIKCGYKDIIIKKTGYISTQNKIEDFINNEKTAGRLTEAGVYFRDLENGPVFGVNETTDFAPASLLKLPLAFVYLTQAERNPNILKEQLSVEKPQWSFDETFYPSKTINPKELHTIEDLLQYMISYSDNNSYGVLQTHIYDTNQKNMMTQTFLELGFIDPASIYDEVLSVRQYSAIFRALYNTSYLNLNLSEKLLDWLSQSDFKFGLVAGVPENIKIAHKFGERVSSDGVKQLHDCGIIYYPNNPYLLCVMTRGKSYDELSNIISNISKDVYQEVDSRRL